MTENDHGIELSLAVILSICSMLVFGVFLKGSFPTMEQRYIVLLTSGFLGLLAIIMWRRWERLTFQGDEQDGQETGFE